MAVGNSSILVYLGEWDQADRTIAEFDGHDLATPVRVPLGHVKAMLHACRGQIEAAEAVLEELAPVYPLVDDPRVEGWRLSTRAFVRWMAGRLDEAYDDGIACAQLARDGAEVGAEFAGHVAVALGDPARARQALELLRSRPVHGHVSATAAVQLEAGIHALEGDRAAAVAGYRSAIAFYRSRELRLSMALALCDYAILARPDEPEAEAAAEEARAILTDLGSPPLLERLETGLAAAAETGIVRRRVAVDSDGAERAVESAAG
jgi:hypothetical protein